MYAHYTETRNLKEVLITRTPSNRTGGFCIDVNCSPAGEPCLNFVAKVKVKGQREARKIAANYKATCWNF
jgi:hypothetical protein